MEKMRGFSNRAVLIYLLYGVVCLLVQVILIRRLLSVFYGNELTIGALFAGWMFWTALGSFIFLKRADACKNPEQELAVIFLLCGLLFFATSSLTWLVRYIFRFTAGELLGFELVLLAGFVFTAPVCILLGASFNYQARLFKGDEANLVWLYLLEALGSALAGIIFSLLMAGRISAMAQIVICTTIFFLSASLLLNRRKSRLIGIGLSLVALAGLLGACSRLERVLVQLRWKGQEVLIETESKYSTITITKRGELTNFWLDGLPAFSYPDPEHFEKIIHLPLAMTREPEKVLLIGGGLKGAVEEVFKHPVKKLVYLQIDPRLNELEAEYLGGFSYGKTSPSLQVYYLDARIFLRQSKEKFDAIILNLPDPETANLNRYYTREFFQLAKAHLSPDGVLGLSLGTSGNYLTPAQAGLLAEGVLTLKQVFSRVAVLALGTNYLVAGESELISEEVEFLLSRLNQRKVKTLFVRDYYLKANLSPERVLFVHKSLKQYLTQPVNIDLRPRGYYLSSLLWLEQANPGLRKVVKRILNLTQKPLFWAVGIYLFLALVLVYALGAGGLGLVSIFGMGFVGLGAELILMLGFQVIYGYVYQLVGALVSGFMGGLSLGAYLYQRYSFFWKRNLRWKLLGVVFGEIISLLLSWVLLRVLVAFHPGVWLSLSVILGLLVLVAVFSGLCFPLSAYAFGLGGKQKTGAIAGWINALDHLGSSIGAVFCSVILIPVFGLEFSLGFFLLLLIAGAGPGIIFYCKLGK